ncbi:hypothetical protein SprV_0602149500 [Sparganum proliferum]
MGDENEDDDRMEGHIDAHDSTDNVGEKNYDVNERKEEDENHGRDDVQDNDDDNGVCHEERDDENGGLYKADGHDYEEEVVVVEEGEGEEAGVDNTDVKRMDTFSTVLTALKDADIRCPPLPAVCLGQSFRFDALAEALRCHKLAAAALTIPHTLSIAEDSLSQLRSLRNVLIVPPASAAVSTNTRCLRFQLVNMIIHQLSRSLKIKLRCNLRGLEGIGLPVTAPGEAAAPQPSRYIDSLLETTRARIRRSLRQAASSLSRTLPRELLLHFRPHSRQTEVTVTAVEKDDTWGAANSELRTEIGELGEMAAS